MFRVKVVKEVKMDVLPSGGIFRELQVVHDTGYFPTSDGQPSFEEDWHQVSGDTGPVSPPGGCGPHPPVHGSNSQTK